MSHVTRRVVRMATLTALAATAGACSYVKQADFQTEMDRMRADMLTGDQAVEQGLSDRIDGVEGSVAALQQRVGALESGLQKLADQYDATVQRLETALRFAAPIHFGFDDATVRDQDRELLQRFSMVVRDHYPDALVTVEGFTDPAGSAAYNLKLGQRRADAVKAALVDQGRLDVEHIKAVSYGEDTSRLVDSSAEGPGTSGAVNRRVVLVIDYAADLARATVTAAGGAGG